MDYVEMFRRPLLRGRNTVLMYPSSKNYHRPEEILEIVSYYNRTRFAFHEGCKVLGFLSFHTHFGTISSHRLDPLCGSVSDMGAIALGSLGTKILALGLAHFLESCTACDNHRQHNEDDETWE